MLQRFQHRRLLELDLSHNSLDTIRKGSFFYLLNLRHLDLSFNRLTSVGDLNSLAKLEWLSLAYNLINALIDTAFEGLHALRWLDLSHNSLSTLGTEPLRTLFYLDTLLLGCNLIDEITNGAGLEHLRTLDVAANRLRSAEFVAALPRLERLQLSHNALGRMPRLSGSVVAANLSFNRITSLDRGGGDSGGRGGGDSGASLQLLDLSHNRLRQLGSAATAHFSWWPQLRTLLLRGNQLSNVTSDALAGLPVLTTLSLADNHLARLPDGLLADAVNLQQLDMSHNPMRALEENTLSSQKALRELRLRDAQLRYLPAAALTNVTSLRLLDISGNQLLKLPDMSGLSELRTLNASRNAVRSIDPAIFSPLLYTLDLSGNPFACTCRLMPLRYWLLNHVHRTTTSSSSSSLGAYTCHSPAEWAGVTLAEFYVEGTACNPHEKVVVFTALSVTLLAVLLLLLVAVCRAKGCCWRGAGTQYDSGARYRVIDDHLTDTATAPLQHTLAPNDNHSTSLTSCDAQQTTSDAGGSTWS